MRRQSVKNTFHVWGDKLWKERERQTSRQWNISDIFFWTGIWVVIVVDFFFGERRMNGTSSWTPPKKGRLIELRQDHYTVSIILPVFLQEPGLVPALSLGVLSGKSFSGRVQKWPSRKRLGTRLGYCFVLDLNWSSSSASLSPWTSQAAVTGMHINEMTFLVQNKR